MVCLVERLARGELVLSLLGEEPLDPAVLSLTRWLSAFRHATCTLYTCGVGGDGGDCKEWIVDSEYVVWCPLI